MLNLTTNMFSNLTINTMYVLVSLVYFVATLNGIDGYHLHQLREPQSPPMPYHSVFNNGKGKTPLVAATYYFNSEPEIKREFIKEAVYADTPDPPEENHVAANNEGYCQAADGRKGSCYDAQECVNKGGMPMGRCEAGGTKRDGSVCCLCK